MYIDSDLCIGSGMSMIVGSHAGAAASGGSKGKRMTSPFDTGKTGGVADMDILVTCVTGPSAQVLSGLFDIIIGQGATATACSAGTASNPTTLRSGEYLASAIDDNTVIMQTRMPPDHLRYVQPRIHSRGGALKAGSAGVWFVMNRQTHE